MQYRLQALTLWPEWIPMFHLPKFEPRPQCLFAKQWSCSANRHDASCPRFMAAEIEGQAHECPGFTFNPPQPKRVENRDWEPERLPRHVIGRWIALHAGKDIGGAKAGKKGQQAAIDAVIDVAARAGWPRSFIAELLRPDRIDTSCITSLARIDAITTQDNADPWAFEPPAWQLVIGELRQLEPIPCKGKQGIWYVEETERQAVLAQCKRHPEWKW